MGILYKNSPWGQPQGSWGKPEPRILGRQMGPERAVDLPLSKHWLPGGWICHGQLRAQEGKEGSLAPWQTPTVEINTDWHQELGRAGSPTSQDLQCHQGTVLITVSLKRRVLPGQPQPSFCKAGDETSDGIGTMPVSSTPALTSGPLQDASVSMGFRHSTRTHGKGGSS